MKTTTKHPAASMQVVAILSMGFVVVTFAGCADGPKRVPVSGVVTIDGQPLTTGSITFTPKEGGRPSTGMIDDQGRFTLTSSKPGDGVTPGEHHVEVHAAEHVGETKVKWHAPKKYHNKKTSGLTETIDQPTDNLEIKLTWDGGKPFVETQR